MTLLKLKKGRLYYYQGNFFQPLVLTGNEPGLVKRAIRDFMKQNAELVKTDRAKPEYKTLVELFDEAYSTSTGSP